MIRRPRENPFPAALLDALAGYAYLIDEVGFEPADIIVVGDSAGGNLALALVRYLIEEDTKLAPPGALILLSPWADMGNSHKEDPLGSPYTNQNSDFPNSPRALARGLEFMPTIPSWPLRALTASDFAGNTPFISPASLYLKDDEVSFENFPTHFHHLWRRESSSLIRSGRWRDA